ncbi:MAG: sugar phosphate isomerase/epimerase [Oscillospiraceae bacterium]
MQTGISSACLFPEYTEKSILELLEQGVKTLELFLNSPCECSENFIYPLVPLLKEYGAKIVSVHPCTSEFEGVSFFGRYPRRFNDSLDFYKKLFNICNILDAPILIFHGARTKYHIPEELYFERFDLLWSEGKKERVSLCQENVVGFYSGSSEFLKSMARTLPRINFVLDIKQCIRAKEDPFFILDTMGKNLKHVHLSDNSLNENCLLPSKGDFDFKKFFTQLKKLNYNENIIIELYRSDFTDITELCKSKEYIDDILYKL